MVENSIFKFQNNIMIEKSLKKLGQNIRNIRNDRKLSQEQLAELLSVSRNYIGMIERAEVNVPSRTLIELAKVLNVHPKTFFDF